MANQVDYYELLKVLGDLLEATPELATLTLTSILLEPTTEEYHADAFEMAKELLKGRSHLNKPL